MALVAKKHCKYFSLVDILELNSFVNGLKVRARDSVQCVCVLNRRLSQTKKQFCALLFVAE